MTIEYNVLPTRQRTQNTCWYAAALTIVRYHRHYAELHNPFYPGSKGYDSNDKGGTIDSPEAAKEAEGDKIFEIGRPISYNNTLKMAAKFNLTAEAVSMTADAVERMLRIYGPLWYGGKRDGFRSGTNSGQGHVVVITGIRTPGAPNVMLCLVDPADGQRMWYDFDLFFKHLKPYEVRGNQVLMIHWPVEKKER